MLIVITVVIVPLIAIYVLWTIELMPINAAVRYAESGKVIGQTVKELDARYNDFDPPSPSPMAKSYLIAVVDIDHAYYLHVAFDEKTGKAVHAQLESADEIDPWIKDVSKPAP